MVPELVEALGDSPEKHDGHRIHLGPPCHARDAQPASVWLDELHLQRGADREEAPRPELRTTGADIDGVTAHPLLARLDPDRPRDGGALTEPPRVQRSKPDMTSRRERPVYGREQIAQRKGFEQHRHAAKHRVIVVRAQIRVARDEESTRGGDWPAR